MTPISKIRVVVADDHTVVRDGFCALLEKAPDMEVVGTAADGLAALRLAQKHEPDVLLIDVEMPRLDGIQTIERLAALGLSTKAVVLTMYEDETLVRRALAHGARGYVLKGASTEELMLAIKSAKEGGLFLSPRVSSAMMASLLRASAHEAPSPAERLTAREREVLQLISEGHTNAAIGQMLGISVKTVEKHRSNIMAKLDAHNLAELLEIATQLRLIFPSRFQPPPEEELDEGSP
jgi:DNA-binding NarL/FixJ family response regulator